jgi:hypothetical protein
MAAQGLPVEALLEQTCVAMCSAESVGVEKRLNTPGTNDHCG